jgi:hypothetical protein
MRDWRRQLEHDRAPNHRPILSHKQDSSLRKIHPLTQLLARAKVRDALGEHFNRIARPGVASDSRLAVTQRERTKAADLDALATGEDVAHLIEDHLYCQFEILSSEVGLLRCEVGDQFGSGHTNVLLEQQGLRRLNDTASEGGSAVTTDPSRQCDSRTNARRMLTLSLEATQRVLGNTEAALKRATSVDALIDDASLRVAIDRFLAVKRAVGEAESGEPLPILNAFIERELTRLESVARSRVRQIDAAVLDQLLLDMVLWTTAARKQSPLEREYA